MARLFKGEQNKFISNFCFGLQESSYLILLWYILVLVSVSNFYFVLRINAKDWIKFS